MSEKVIAIIPARGGSKGLPGKNTRLFSGKPLLAHSILCAKMVPEIDEVIVSTDSPEITQCAVEWGANVHVRPAALATDESPVWFTIKHAMERCEGGFPCKYVVLLEPTSPCRRPEWISGAISMLDDDEEADGVHGVVVAEHNPIWNAFTLDRGKYAQYLIERGRFLHRRQDVPQTYHANGSLHVWKRRTVDERESYVWAKHLLYETDPGWSCSIDSLEEFDRLEALVDAGIITLPWEGLIR